MKDVFWSKKEEYIKYLINLGCFEFYPQGVTLKSGKVSNFYANLRKTTETLLSAARLGEYIVTFCKEKHIIMPSYNPGNYTLFYGVPEGAIKAGFFAQLTYLWDKNVLSRKDTSITPGSLYYLRIKGKDIQLINLHDLDIVANYLRDLIDDRGIEVDSVYGDPSKIYREIAFLLSIKLHESSGKNYYLPQLREVPKDHGLIENKYFIGKPHGNVLVLSEYEDFSFNLTHSLEEIKKYSKNINKIIPFYDVLFNSYIKSMINENIQVLNPSFKELFSFEVIVIEDVVTTGASVIKEIEKLRSLGLKVKAVISLYDRKENDIEKLMRERKVEYYALSEANDVLPLLSKKRREC